MKYSFDEIIPRRGSNSVKWDDTLSDKVLPLWVADMDFHVAPAITEALQKRIEHGIFGYVHVPDSYYESVIDWFKRRHQWTVSKDWIIYTTGVVPAISAIIKSMTSQGDKVLIQTPVYNCFFSSIKNNECEIVENELRYHNNEYTIDFDDLENKTADDKVKVMILCNPHNPAGRVWTVDELKRIGEICIRNNVFVIADEIHCELVFKEYHYTPFASISKEFLFHSATCTSPSKAFNIAGLQIANIIVADDSIRRKIDKAININEVCDVNPFGIVALQAAYNDSEEWLDQLIDYLQDNYEYLKRFFRTKLPQFPVLTLEGTYLVWINCSALQRNASSIAKELLDDYYVWLNSGEMYGSAGKDFVRVNIACPRSTLVEALDRIETCWKKQLSL